MNTIITTLIFTLVLVGLAMVLLAIRILIKKGGKFPNTHISGSKALRKKGISCALSQDRQARNESK